MKIQISAVMIAYENEDRSIERLRRDLLPALCDFDAELIVIDNSALPLARLQQTVGLIGEMLALPGCYHWNNGENLLYGPSLNLACTLASHPYLLYVCTNHGQTRDPGWAADLIAPLLADPGAAMSGSLYTSGPDHLGFPEELPAVHIQGGVFAARREHLLAHPWPQGRYAHYPADIYQSYQLMAAGLRLVDVETVKSVWFSEDLPEQPWPFKFVHDSGHERC